MILVDSDVEIEVQRASLGAKAWLANLHGEPALPSAVAWELIVGSRNAIELSRAETFFGQRHQAARA